MTKILVLMTKSKSLGLLDGEQHDSGFWAEEFVVPYELFVGSGCHVDIATVDGEAPAPDEGSLTPAVVANTRPAGSPDRDEQNVQHYRKVIESVEALRHPLNVSDITRDHLAEYDGVYICGGHGAMDDMPHDPGMTRLVRWVLELEKPLSAVCHGLSAALPVRDAHGRWPLEGFELTAFSHDEELVTEMAGRLPFVLEFELERLGSKYRKASVAWDACVVEDRNLVTGQNPYSSAPLAEAFLARVATTSGQRREVVA
jgi:putative intracellular protease/amidase